MLKVNIRWKKISTAALKIKKNLNATDFFDSECCIGFYPKKAPPKRGFKRSTFDLDVPA
jgi:hypothetical protein